MLNTKSELMESIGFVMLINREIIMEINKSMMVKNLSMIYPHKDNVQQPQFMRPISLDTTENTQQDEDEVTSVADNSIVKSSFQTADENVDQEAISLATAISVASFSCN
jgi:hypothetical protein